MYHIIVYCWTIFGEYLWGGCFYFREAEVEEDMVFSDRGVGEIDWEEWSVYCSQDVIYERREEKDMCLNVRKM